MNVKAPEASLEQELDIFFGVYTNKWISIQGDESEEESKSDRLLFFEEWPEGALSDYTKSKNRRMILSSMAAVVFLQRLV